MTDKKKTPRKAQLAAGPQKIMLIRHAEKPNDVPPYGIKLDGSKSKRSIIVRGWQRAGALVPFFERPRDPRIATPDSIFAATTTENRAVSKDDARSLRPQQTIGPISERLGCPTNVTIAVGQERTLVTALKKSVGVVLVAWEHKRIPVIASAFARVPLTWSDDVYDVVWVLDRRVDGSYAFAIVHQALLAGDAPADAI